MIIRPQGFEKTKRKIPEDLKGQGRESDPEPFMSPDMFLLKSEESVVGLRGAVSRGHNQQLVIPDW